MKKLKNISCLLIGIIILFLCISPDAGALTSGETYTISVQKVNSNGILASASSSTTSTAGSDGKISFILNNIPDNSSCNFLLITIADSAANTVRRSIAPCPNAGESLPMGASGLTASQTDALLAALVAAGTDDPILAVFGFAIVRSTAMTAAELTFMADLCNQGINNANGFVDYLTDNGVTAAQVATYKKKIIARLANTSTGYSKFIKDSVDASTDATKLDARGEAASKLLLVLVQAATDTGFSQDRVLEAFNAMGAIVVPLLAAGVGSGDITAATNQMIESSIGGGLQKLKADRDTEKYSAALTTLGASSTDVTNYQTAAATLMNAMTAAFKTFEQVFDGSETNGAISTADTAFNTAMTAAFDTFITDTSSSTTRLNTMITNIDTAIAGASGLTAAQFTFYKSNGSEVNWPLTMVILTDWISSIVTATGSFTYSRDNTAIPAAMIWVGSCNDNQWTNKTACEADSDTWTSERSTFGGAGAAASYGALFGIQEDIEILEFVRFAAQAAAGGDMGDHQTLEKNFSDSVTGLSANIGGTTDGSTNISATEKSAIITLMKSPQF